MQYRRDLNFYFTATSFQGGAIVNGPFVEFPFALPARMGTRCVALRSSCLEEHDGAGQALKP